MTIRLISTVTTVKVLVDRPPKQQAGKGDVFWATTTLRNDVAQFGRPAGAVVGSDAGTYSVVSATQTDVKGTATLPGGTLRVAGKTRGVPGETIHVTGGAGKFAKARGVVQLFTLNAQGTRVRNVYRLRLP